MSYLAKNVEEAKIAPLLRDLLSSFRQRSSGIPFSNFAVTQTNENNNKASFLAASCWSTAVLTCAPAILFNVFEYELPYLHNDILEHEFISLGSNNVWCNAFT